LSTPPYAPPSVGPNGLAVPGYQSILADNLQAYLNIYGQNQYIGPDSAIYQLLSILSLKQADNNTGLQLTYNQSSPKTAVGTGLDRVVAMNGLAREAATFSTAILNLTGTAGAVLTNAFAQDVNGNLWAIPSPTTLGAGTTTVTAVCTTPGAVAAPANTINIVATPQPGWTPPSATVNNPVAANPGLPAESDSALRARQAISMALPSTTPIASTVAALLAIDGVTRIAPGYPTPGGPGSSIENPTGGVDSWGNPPHSISLVIENGDNQTIANTIYAKKTIGCFTNGTTAVVVTDAVTGWEETISFFRPSYVPIFALIKVHGYTGTPTSATLAAVQAAVVAYLNDLAIGETVSIGAVNYEATAINAVLTAPGFGVQSLQLGTLAAATTAVTTSGSPSITVSSAAGLAIGQLAVGAGIPPGTIILSIAGTTIGLSANCTASGSVTVDFSTLAGMDVPMPNYFYVAQGVMANVAVLAV
jgi:uncharacterized phage protein gp47/JayE